MSSRFALLSVLLIALSACAEPPEAIVAQTFAALQRGDAAEAMAHVDPSYSDPLGGRAELEHDLRDLIQSTGRIEISTDEVATVDGETKLVARVIGQLDVHLVGEPEWRASGPLELDLVRDGEFRIRSGLLSDLRDVKRTMAERRAALEGNDAALYAKLLHPTYRDGDVDREATEERLRQDLSGARIRMEPSLYKLELRGPLAHVDEYYALTVNDRALPPAIARLTLRPAAGFWRIAAGLYPPTEEAR